MKRFVQKINVFLLTIALLVGAALPYSVSANVEPGAVIPDGEYSVSYRYVKDGTTETSAADAFMKKDSGKLIVSDGKAVFEHEVSKSNYATFAYLAARKSGAAKAVITKVDNEETATGQEGYEAAAVRDAENPDHVIVQLAIEDIWKKQDILMHINDKENYFNLPTPYNHWYNVQLEIAVSDIVLPETPGSGGEEPQAPEVDKSRLIQWIETAAAWVQGKADAGEREAGKPAAINTTPVSDGEYLPITYFGPAVGYKGPVTNVKEKIAQVQLMLDNEQATQEEVNSMFNEANAVGAWELFDKQRLVAQDIEILVLDSLEKDAKISPYAADISPNAVMLQQAGPDYYQAFANFAFFDANNELTDSSIRTVSASAADGFFSRWAANPARSVKNADLTNTPAFRDLLSGEQSETIKVYQADVRSGNATYKQTDELWQGLWKLEYPMELPEAERKTVFISFNKAYLDALQKLVDEALLLVKNAEEGTEVGQHSAYYIEQLEAAVTAAQETADQLASPRPEILKATAALQGAIDAFKAAETKQVYFTAAHGSEAAFSRMNSYFEKPALVATDDEGRLHVTLTLTGSSNVQEFKVKAGEDFVEAETVSTDEAADSRVVAFEASSLSALLEAQVRIVVPEQNYDQVHSIRLNFNDVDNQKLYELLQTAAAAYDEVENREQSGEYDEVALAALAKALATANEEAVRNPAQQAATDDAYARLNSALETFKNTAGGGDPGTGPNPGTPGASNPVYPADGSYYMPFTIYKHGTTQASVANGYVVPSALVNVSGGTKTVSFTVLQSKEITGLTINGSSGSVTHTDTALNQRIVSFVLSDLSQTLEGWVKVDWPEVSYHHDYAIQFKFHEAQAVYAGTAPQVPGTTQQPGVPNLPNPGSGTETGNDGEEKPSGENTGTPTGEKPSGSEAATEVEAPSITFSDVANHWARTSIEKAVKLGIVKGFSDGSFRPNGTVTRAEFAVMISRALQLEGNADGSSFKDYSSIPGWAQPHVARVADAGLISGYSDETFRANDQLTRAQLAVIIARAAKLELDTATALDFSDAAQIPGWAQKEVSAAVKAGLILGKEKDRFDPNGTATRAEALTLIIRLLEL